MASTRPPLSIVKAFHDGNAVVDDRTLERALHIRPHRERGDALTGMLRKHGNQHFAFTSASFHDIREIFRRVPLKSGDVFCDAGAGLGHVVFYGAQVAPGHLRAIEILPARCKAMARTAAALNAEIEIVCGDALTQDYSDVSVLLLNSPFFPTVAAEFTERLASAKLDRLTIVAMNNIVAAFRDNPAFAEIESGADVADYRFGVFRRKTPARTRGITPAATAPSPPAQSSQTTGAARTAATSARGGTARR